MVKKCLLLILVFNCSITFGAINNYWVGGSGSDWHTAANWSEGHYPIYDSSETAYISMNATDGYTVYFTEYASYDRSPYHFYLGRDTDPAGTYTLNITSTGFFCNVYSYIGSQGVINVNGGNYTTFGTKQLDGIVSVNDGIYKNRSYVWRISGYLTLNAGSTLIFYNGTRFSETSSDITVPNSYFTGVIDLCGGEMQMQGDCTTALGSHITSGNIRSHGSIGGVNCVYDPNTNKTYISATSVANYWTGAGDGVTWCSNSNWSAGYYPIYNTDSSEIAYLGMNATANCIVNYDGTGHTTSPGDFYLGRDIDPADTYTLNIEDSAYFYNVFLYLGPKGVINLDGGDFNCYGAKQLDGEVNIEDGTFTNRSYIWKIGGYVKVNQGGVLNFNNGTRFSHCSTDITVPNSDFTGIVDLWGGQMTMQGNCTTALRWHVYNGNIIAYGDDPDYGIVVNYDPTENKTYVYADTAGINCTFYYDADTSNTWATDSASYPDLSDWSYTSPFSVVQNKWYRKTGSSTAFSGTVFQGVGPYLPQLTTTITGIDSSKAYDVYVVFHARNVGGDWHIYASMPDETLQLYDETNSTILRVNTLITCQAKIGTISGSNSVSVNVDGPIGSENNDQRAWYDGIALVEVFTLTANPSTVEIPINQTGSTTISWPAAGVSTVSLYESVNQAPETSIDSGSGMVPGNWTVNTINRGSTHDFNLYAGPDNTYPLLESVRVEGYKLMRANEYCSVPVDGRGTCKLSYGPSGYNHVQLYRSINGGPEIEISTNTGTSPIDMTLPWIDNNCTYLFRLYAGTNKTILLDECLVTGRRHMPSEQSEYLSLTSDAVITTTTTLLSREIYIPGNAHDVYVQSDGSYYPNTISTNNDTYSIYITVDGQPISNKSGIRWYSSTDPVEHCFNCIGLIKGLESGTHKFALVAEHSGGNGIFGVGADSNLSIMIDPAPQSLQDISDGVNYINIDTEDYESTGVLDCNTVASHSFASDSQDVVSMISGVSFYQGGTGDALWGIYLNGSSQPNTLSSRTVNDIWYGAELYAPMYAHAYFPSSITSSSDLISFEATEYPWVGNPNPQNLIYGVQEGSRLISLGGGMSVSGNAPDEYIVYQFGSSDPNDTRLLGDIELLTSESITIPYGHNGQVLFNAKARCLGDSSNLVDNDPNTHNVAYVYFWIEIDGQYVGSMGIQQFGEWHCESQRTLCASYFAAGDDALSEGTHTVNIYTQAIASPEDADVEVFSIRLQSPLLWFD